MRYAERNRGTAVNHFVLMSNVACSSGSGTWVLSVSAVPVSRKLQRPAFAIVYAVCCAVVSAAPILMTQLAGSRGQMSSFSQTLVSRLRLAGLYQVKSDKRWIIVMYVAFGRRMLNPIHTGGCGHMFGGSTS